jgi:CheY-like chemotaxis protein
MPSPTLAKESELEIAPWYSFVAGRASMNVQGHSRSVILCVDDRENETEVELFKRVLETAGYGVLATTSADEALEIFQHNHVDLVLTEHIVPAVTGAPTLPATMKTLKPDVPVAIYSADLAASPEDMQFADMFISKLVSIDELLCTIEKLLSRSPTRVAT